MPIMKKILDGMDDKECSDFVTGKMSLNYFTSHWLPLIESLSNSETKAHFLFPNRQSMLDSKICGPSPCHMKLPKVHYLRSRHLFLKSIEIILV